MHSPSFPRFSLSFPRRRESMNSTSAENLDSRLRGNDTRRLRGNDNGLQR
jgi:hypothetical protein